MEKQIVVKLDFNSLEETRKEIQSIVKAKDDKIVRLMIMMSLIILTTCSFLLVSFYQNFIVLTVALVVIFLLLLVYDLYKRIKVFFEIKKLNADFEKFKVNHKEIAFGYYTIYSDRLEYDGYSKQVYEWTDFLNILIYQNSFVLNTGSPETTFGVSKVCMVNEEDYFYFKDFAIDKLSNLP